MPVDTNRTTGTSNDVIPITHEDGSGIIEAIRALNEKRLNITEVSGNLNFNDGVLNSPVDNSLKEDSNNPVENKVITPYLKTGFQADENDRAGYIGMRIEGGGTIYFDYKIGFSGTDVSVAAKTGPFKTYHVDPVRNIVICDNPKDTGKLDRFYVVSDYDIGDYKHGTNLMWSNGTSGTLYAAMSTSTDFGTGQANTQKCIDAASTDGLLEWNSNAYNVIWHYVWKGDWLRETDRGTNQWFVPSRDELALLCDMQYAPKTRKSADGSVTIPLLPINFYSYYWSSSQHTTTSVAWTSDFYDGSAKYTNYKDVTNSIHVRLVRTF